MTAKKLTFKISEAVGSAKDQEYNFVEISTPVLKFELGKPVAFRLLSIERMKSELGANNRYQIELLDGSRYHFLGTREVNELVNEPGAIYRLTLLGYKDKDAKKGRIFKIEKAVNR